MGQWTPPSLAEELRLLRAARSVAIVGVSPNPSRPSYEIAEYLLSAPHLDAQVGRSQARYEVYFVNPAAIEILGRPVAASLADLEVVPDIVNVFRKSADLMGVAYEAIAVGAKVLWLQLGLYDEAVAKVAHEAGMAVVMDRCLKVEHSRLAGSALS